MVGSDAGADAGDVGFAEQRDDGDAHGEGFAGGGGAVVGEGVERDVDVAIEGKMLAICCSARGEDDLIFGQAVGLELGSDLLRGRWSLSSQNGPLARARRRLIRRTELVGN